MFSGSLVLPYIIRHINKDIKISCYEHNPYLTSFYDQIKNNLKNFIIEYGKIIDTLKSINNPGDKIKEMVKNINVLDKTNQSVCYYISLKVSFNGMINYNKNHISLTIDKKHLNSLLNNNLNHVKLKDFSNFLSTIKIYKSDIKYSYNDILSRIDKNTIVYINPPYFDKYSYKLYFGTFNEESNINSIFIKELYNNYNINDIVVKSQMNRKEFIRNEILITNFDYKLEK